MFDNWKKMAVMLVVAVVAIAIVFRVSKLRSVVTGQPATTTRAA